MDKEELLSKLVKEQCETEETIRKLCASYIVSQEVTP